MPSVIAFDQAIWDSSLLSKRHLLLANNFSITFKNNHLGSATTFCLIIACFVRYTVRNTAATPLNNAQPWWLFFARSFVSLSFLTFSLFPLRRFTNAFCENVFRRMGAT